MVYFLLFFLFYLTFVDLSIKLFTPILTRFHSFFDQKYISDDHGTWYQQLFPPSVAVGLVKPESLAGYRTSPVYIRGSMHVPLKPEAVPDAMSIFFELLAEETDPAVRVILGHFVYVYIHPYMDGNGRTGRFLMNVMLAAAGYPWLVIPVQARVDYMAALEVASVGQDIRPFSHFLIRHLSVTTPPVR